VSSSQNQSAESGPWNKYQLEWHHYICLIILLHTGLHYFTYVAPFSDIFKENFSEPYNIADLKKTSNLEKFVSPVKNCIFGKIWRMAYIFTVHLKTERMFE
jgi:hypothetical protein